ncbi:signal peptidase [Parapedobacter sp. 2B3]|uniref:signal peptidase n=1 Tax=Parapedobacter sp. 2B3 TaxID=3342381 RepID=UPI0035B628F8
MNRYLLRGIIGTALGLAFCLLGLYLMGEEISGYKWILVLGVVVFGVGFLTIVYSLIRKIERRSLLDERRKNTP